MSEALQREFLGNINTATYRISADPLLFLAQLLSHEIIRKLLFPFLHAAQSQVSKLQVVRQRQKKLPLILKETGLETLMMWLKRL